MIIVGLTYGAIIDHIDGVDRRKARPWIKPVLTWPIVFAALSICPVSAYAATSALCDRAAQTASDQTGVPLNVLLAITRTETGRAKDGQLKPWPWTVNMEGAGKWFSSRDEALDFVSKSYRRGARSFDIGCFQINYRWHGDHFASIREMFDPEANAIYAANFLKNLNGEKQDWSAAAGAYHSRTIQFSTRYRDRFDKVFAALSQADIDQPLTKPARKAGLADQDDNGSVTRSDNRYPFLKNVIVETRLGSLVPIGAGDAATGHLFSRTGG